MGSFRCSWLLYLVTASLFSQGQLEVIAAYYGSNDRFADVTRQVRSIAQQSGNNALTVTVGTYAMGLDPAPGTAKVLRVYYKLNGTFDQGEWRDGDTAQIGQRVSRGSARDRGRNTGGVRGSDMSYAPLRITRAVYGEGSRTIDVSALLQSRVVNNRLEVEVNNASMGKDPAPAVVKELLLTYEYGGRAYDVRVPENQWLRIPESGAVAAVPVPAASNLRVVRAQYGQGARVNDVTSLLANRVSGDRLTMNADNASLGGDPAVGADKQLYVIYEWNGQQYEVRAKEGARLDLPSSSATLVGSSTSNQILSKPGASTSVQDGVCFYPERDYQGTPYCLPLGQNVSQLPSASYGSVRFLGRASQLDVFETAGFQGRTLRIQSSQADLSQLGGGSFFGTNSWVTSPASLRVY